MEPHSALANEGARRIAGRLIGGLIVAGAAIAVVVTLLQWSTRPQTDDATVRANLVGIAPQVSGHIVELHVRDNQQVHEGDVLFIVDPRPYEIALARTRAALALTRKEVEGLRKGVSTADAGVARAAAQLNASAADVVRREADPVAADAEIARLEAQRVASEAALQRAKAELRHAEDHLARLEPLLPEKFVTEDRVDEARTRRISAAMAAEQARTSILAADAALNEARARKRAAVATLEATRAQHLATEAGLRQSKSERARAEDAVGQVANMNARVAAAEAALHSAELDLEYTRVRAPFSGRVVNLNISTGAFPYASRSRIPTNRSASGPRRWRPCTARSGPQAGDSGRLRRLPAPRAGADARPWQRDLPADAGLRHRDHPDPDSSHPACADCDDRDESHHPGGHRRDAGRLHSRRGGCDGRPGRRVARLDGGSRYRLATYRVLRRLRRRRIVAQAGPGHRRARVGVGLACGTRDGPSGCGAHTTGESRRVRAVDLVVRHARPRRERGGAAPVGPRRSARR